MARLEEGEIVKVWEGISKLLVAVTCVPEPPKLLVNNPTLLVESTLPVLLVAISTVKVSLMTPLGGTFWLPGWGMEACTPGGVLLLPELLPVVKVIVWGEAIALPAWSVTPVPMVSV